MLDMLVSSMSADGLLLFCGRTPFQYGPDKYNSSAFSEAKQLILDT